MPELPQETAGQWDVVHDDRTSKVPEIMDVEKHF